MLPRHPTGSTVWALAPLPPSSGELANAWGPYVETCIEVFGANRCMCENNFPVDKGACSYPVLFDPSRRAGERSFGVERSDLFAAPSSCLMEQK